MQEEIVRVETTPVARTGVAQMKTRALPLSQIGYEKHDRVASGIEEFDTVLGGGIVRGSLVLLGGDPGIGKSTLLTQVSAHLAKTRNVLYVSAEESCSQVKMRCERLGVNSDNLYLLNETCLEDIDTAVDGNEFVVIDSIQAVYTETLTSSASSACASVTTAPSATAKSGFFL